MSYDIWVEVPACECCGRPATSEGDWNYTSNCGPMWRAAGADLAEFDGKPAGECAPVLRAALEVMRADPGRFRAMDPPNGWGSYDSLLPRLEVLAELFECVPKGTVKVWR